MYTWAESWVKLVNFCPPYSSTFFMKLRTRDMECSRHFEIRVSIIFFDMRTNLLEYRSLERLIMNPSLNNKEPTL